MNWPLRATWWHLFSTDLLGEEWHIYFRHKRCITALTFGTKLGRELVRHSANLLLPPDLKEEQGTFVRPNTVQLVPFELRKANNQPRHLFRAKRFIRKLTKIAGEKTLFAARPANSEGPHGRHYLLFLFSQCSIYIFFRSFLFLFHIFHFSLIFLFFPVY